MTTNLVFESVYAWYTTANVIRHEPAAITIQDKPVAYTQTHPFKVVNAMVQLAGFEPDERIAGEFSESAPVF